MDLLTILLRGTRVRDDNCYGLILQVSVTLLLGICVAPDDDYDYEESVRRLRRQGRQVYYGHLENESSSTSPNMMAKNEMDVELT